VGLVTSEPGGDARRVVLVSVNGVRAVDPTWSAWLRQGDEDTSEREAVVVDITRGASS
jgi:hypothetical protein